LATLPPGRPLGKQDLLTHPVRISTGVGRPNRRVAVLAIADVDDDNGSTLVGNVNPPPNEREVVEMKTPSAAPGGLPRRLHLHTKIGS
jgi:hypothetical protein